MTKIVMRAAMPAAQAIKDDGIPYLQPENVSQFLIAALIGSGVYSYEKAKSRDLPFVLYTPKYSVPTSNQALRRDAVLERVRKALCRAYKNDGKELPSDIELEAMATKVLSHVIDHIQRLGLYLNTQKLLFSRQYADIAMSILAETKDPITNLPVTASGAIGAGLIPPPPTRDLKGHLNFLRTEKSMQTYPAEPFGTWVARTRPFVVEFPPPDFSAGALSRADQYSQGPTVTTSVLGLGFVLIAKDSFLDNYSVVAPTVVHYKSKDQAHNGWRADRHARSVGGPAADLPKLRSLLADKKYQAAQLDTCSSCGEIFSNDRADLQLQCACAK